MPKDEFQPENSEAWILYAIVFLWQFPHFMSIAWMYREDYERAEYLVLPKSHARGRVVIVETMLPLRTLIPISILQLPVPQWPGAFILQRLSR